MKATIQFHYLYAGFRFEKRKEVKKFLVEKFTAKGRDVDTINYVFCDDAYLLKINKQYLQHDTLTDIITFELSAKNQPLISDIYISIERVKENAVKYGTSFSQELHRVIFHGALHLMGYKDKTSRDKKRMREMEELLLQEYFVSRNTVSR